MAGLPSSSAWVRVDLRFPGPDRAACRHPAAVAQGEPGDGDFGAGTGEVDVEDPVGVVAVDGDAARSGVGAGALDVDGVVDDERSVGGAVEGEGASEAGVEDDGVAVGGFVEGFAQGAVAGIAVAVVGVVELGDGPGGGGGGGAGGGGEGEGGGAERGGDGGHEGAGLVEPSRFGAASGSVEVQCGSGGLGHCVPCRGWLVANVWTPGSVTRGILADRADPVRDRPDAWSVNRPWRPVSGSPVWFSR